MSGQVRCPCCGGFGYHEDAPGRCGDREPVDGVFGCARCSDSGMVPAGQDGPTVGRVPR